MQENSPDQLSEGKNINTDFETAFGPGREEDKNRKRRSRIIWIAVFVIVNAAVIFFTARDEFGSGRPDPLGYKFRFSNVMFLIAGFGCLFAALFFETMKYIVMMKAMGQRVSVKVAFETAALGKYYDNITPSGAGGQAFQIYHVYKNGYSPGVSAAMPLNAFLNMQLAFVFLAILVFIFRGNAVEMTAMRIPAYVGAVFYSIVPALIILFAISDKLARRIIAFFIRIGGKLRLVSDVDSRLSTIFHSLEDYRQSLAMMAKNGKAVIMLFVFSLLYQIAISSIPFFVLHAYQGRGTYLDITAMTVFIYCAITIIPTPGNAGAAEGSFYLVFSSLESSGLFWGMLIWRVICYYSFIVIGILIYGYNALADRIKSRRLKHGQ